MTSAPEINSFEDIVALAGDMGLIGKVYNCKSLNIRSSVSPTVTDGPSEPEIVAVLNKGDKVFVVPEIVTDDYYSIITFVDSIGVVSGYCLKKYIYLDIEDFIFKKLSFMSRIDTFSESIDSAIRLANSAQSTANTAKSTAETAKSTVNTAKSTAESALPLTGGQLTSTTGYVLDLRPDSGIALRQNNRNIFKVNGHGQIKLGAEGHQTSLSHDLINGSCLYLAMNNSASEKISTRIYSDGVIECFNGTNPKQEYVKIKNLLIPNDGLTMWSSDLNSQKKFKITVDDTGTLTATEVNE